jgi:hypothetical protein
MTLEAFGEGTQLGMRPSRFRIQFGLAALTAATIWSACFIWFQFVERTVVESEFLVLKEWRQQGWPIAIRRQLTDRAIDDNVDWFKAKGPSFVKDEPRIRASLSERQWHRPGLVVNSIVWLLSTMAVGVLAEVLYRRFAPARRDAVTANCTGYRFSLARLVVAVVFLGVFVGLNMRKIGPMEVLYGVPCSYRGWPLPFYGGRDERAGELQDAAYQVREARAACEAALEDDRAYRVAAIFYRLPLTHQTYRLLHWGTPHRFAPRPFIVYAIIDTLFALTVLTLILFYHPRRKPPDEAPA